ncbi:heavy-metal-associated domain-containing protein [uncultured Flavobacterium sp.]|uniref:heavy-metal-associated domain-containing protein n=1 Tax=uncultured Flavobacterium sp. TaxID=165435 RepID=UPI0030EF253A
MEYKIYVQNLKCGGCAKTITNKLNGIKGVSNLNIYVEDSLVILNCTEIILEKVKETLKKAGYPEDGEQNSLSSKAKSYVSCAIGNIG